jgi:transposase
VIDAVEAGASRREAAELFDVDASTAVRWLQCWNETRCCEPKPRGGSLSPLERYAEQILALVAEQPDRTLEEIVAELRKRVARQSGWEHSDNQDGHFGGRGARMIVAARR